MHSGVINEMSVEELEAEMYSKMTCFLNLKKDFKQIRFELAVKRKEIQAILYHLCHKIEEWKQKSQSKSVQTSDAFVTSIDC